MVAVMMVQSERWGSLEAATTRASRCLLHLVQHPSPPALEMGAATTDDWGSLKHLLEHAPAQERLALLRTTDSGPGFLTKEVCPPSIFHALAENDREWHSTPIPLIDCVKFRSFDKLDSTPQSLTAVGLHASGFPSRNNKSVKRIRSGTHDTPRTRRAPHILTN